MSTSTPAANEAATEPKPKSAFLPMLIAGLVSTVLAAGLVLGAGYWLLRSGKLTPVQASGANAAAKPAATPAEGVSESGEKELPPSKVVPLEPMVVNLSDEGGRSYLRASISLRMADEAAGKAKKEGEGKPDPAAAAGKTAALRDTTIGVLGAQTSAGLLAPDGVSAVKKRLRERYALENPEVHVLDVYFTDFLVQRG